MRDSGVIGHLNLFTYYNVEDDFKKEHPHTFAVSISVIVFDMVF